MAPPRSDGSCTASITGTYRRDQGANAALGFIVGISRQDELPPQVYGERLQCLFVGRKIRLKRCHAVMLIRVGVSLWHVSGSFHLVRKQRKTPRASHRLRAVACPQLG